MQDGNNSQSLGVCSVRALRRKTILAMLGLIGMLCGACQPVAKPARDAPTHPPVLTRASDGAVQIAVGDVMWDIEGYADPIKSLLVTVRQDRHSSRFRTTWSGINSQAGIQATALYDRRAGTLTVYYTSSPLREYIGKVERGRYRMDQVTEARIAEATRSIVERRYFPAKPEEGGFGALAKGNWSPATGKRGRDVP